MSKEYIEAKILVDQAASTATFETLVNQFRVICYMVVGNSHISAVSDETSVPSAWDTSTEVMERMRLQAYSRCLQRAWEVVGVDYVRSFNEHRSIGNVEQAYTVEGDVMFVPHSSCYPYGEVELGELIAKNPILKFFSYKHLPELLQAVSKPIALLAYRMAAEMPSGPETTTGLRKLLEAKDCFVRARL